MSRHKLLPLFSALAFAVTSEADAQSASVLEYAAKFTCGRLPASEAAGGGDADIVVGVYATSINIHNPQRHTKISFTKKVVLAKPEGQAAATPVKQQDTLGPDQAEFIDCPLIFSLLGIATPSHIEGFVVVEVPPTEVPTPTGKGRHAVLLPLDIVGKYSARPSTGEVSALEVVVYSPTQISN